MQEMFGVKYYTINDIHRLLGLKKDTLRKNILCKRILGKKIKGIHYIPEKEFNRLKQQMLAILKPTYIDKETIKNDIWLSNEFNLMKISDWAHGTHVVWSKFSLIDFIKYWQYIVKPTWIRTETYKIMKEETNNNCPKPHNKWLFKHHFRGFVNAFNKISFNEENIHTITQLFNYMRNNNLY